jgi:hypothetical protein
MSFVERTDVYLGAVRRFLDGVVASLRSTPGTE